jgi:hypothetical protein
VIRSLGASFCGLNPDDLSTSKLNAIPKKKAPGAKKEAKKQRSSDDQSSAKASKDEGASSRPQ